MNFKASEKLFDAVNKYIKIDNCNIKTEGHKSYFGEEYTADYVEIINDKNSSVSFEVTENEIIIFFFSDHIHFCDNESELEEDETDYVDRAVEFFEKLFTLPIERKYTIKGNKIIRDESFFIVSQTEKESCAGITLCFSGIKNIFKKKNRVADIIKFDAATGKFTTTVK